MMRDRRFSLLFLGLSLVPACVGDDPVGGEPPPAADAGPDGTGPAGDATPNDSQVTITANETEIVRGNEADVPLDIAWVGAQEPLTLTVSAQPGLTVGEAAVAAGATNATLRVAVAAEAAFGARTLKVQAKAGERLVAEGNVPVFVRGRAGELDTSFGEEGNAQVPGGTSIADTLMPLDESRFLVIGGMAGAVGGLLLLQYDANGRLDPAFGGGTWAHWSEPQGYNFRWTDGRRRRPTFARVGDAFAFACPLAKSDNTRFPASCRVTANGASPTVLPSPPVASPFPSSDGDGVVSDDGLLVYDRGVVRRLTSSGIVDSSFSPIDLIPTTYTQSRAVEIIASNQDRILIRGTGRVDSSQKWESYALADRRTGTVLASSANTLPRTGYVPAGDFGIGTLTADGDGIVHIASTRYLRLRPGGGTGAEVVGGAGLTELDRNEDVGLSLRTAHDGQLLLLVAKPSLIRVDLLDSETLASRQRVQILEGPQLENQLAAADVILSTHRSIIIRFRAGNEIPPENPDYPNITWLIRRYWL